MRGLPLSFLAVSLVLLGCGGSGSGSSVNSQNFPGVVSFSSPSDYNGERSQVVFDAIVSEITSEHASFRAGGTPTSISPDRVVEIDLDAPDLSVGSEIPFNGDGVTELRYRQGGLDFRDWHSTSGSVLVESNDGTQIVLKLKNVRVEAFDGTAQGAVTLNGTFKVTP